MAGEDRPLAERSESVDSGCEPAGPVDGLYLPTASEGREVGEDARHFEFRGGARTWLPPGRNEDRSGEGADAPHRPVFTTGASRNGKYVPSRTSPTGHQDPGHHDPVCRRGDGSVERELSRLHRPSPCIAGFIRA